MKGIIQLPVQIKQLFSVSVGQQKRARHMGNQPGAKQRQTDSMRLYLDVIEELAQRFHPYPQRLVEAFQSISRELFVPEALREVFGARVQNDEGYAGLLSAKCDF